MRDKNVSSEKKEEGFVMMSMYLLLPLLVILTGVLLAHAWTDARASQRAQSSLQGLYLAEAGLDQALVQLRQDSGWAGESGTVGAIGNYSVTVEDLGEGRLRLTSEGIASALFAPTSRTVEMVVESALPADFYDYVIWAAQNLDFKGNAYEVTGKVLHGDTSPTSNTGNVDGSVTYDSKADPLPRLDYEELYEIAVSQGNVYDADRLANGHGVFPSSFWYQTPTDPNDPTTGVPNVNYITADLVLNGNIGTIGGFFVVVGNVRTDPSAQEDTTVNGNGRIQGAIYSTGDFRINGGGGELNIEGTVWAGKEARANGNAALTYNASYLEAIEALGIEADMTVVSWREV